jgi:hypothetical protein
MLKKSMLSTLSIILLTATLLSGCGASKQYQSYLDAQLALNANRQQPGITQRFDSQGRLTGQSIILPQMPINIEQERPSEWASVFKTAFAVGLPVAGMVMNTYAAGEAFTNVAEAVQGNTYTTVGGNMAGGNLEIPTTTTTTTETITNPAPMGE